MSRQLKYINGQWCVIDSETGEETGKKSIPKDVTTRIEQEEEPEPYCCRTYLDHFVFELEDRPVYPYRIVYQLGLRTLDFAPVTILYGGNGSGKSTLLNIIAENTGISRRTQGNTNEYFSSYVSKCAHETAPFLSIPDESEFLRSEDIMDHIVKGRRRYSSAKNMAMKETRLLPDLEGIEKQMMNNFLNDPDALSSNDRFFLSRCHYGMASAHEASQLCSSFESNGEVAFARIREMIMPDCLYLLDEPENSLSPVLQTQLAKMIEAFAGGLRSQFIIATHSPFFLSMENARIYDLDSRPVRIREWYELENMQAYYSLFENNREKFQNTICQED